MTNNKISGEKKCKEIALIIRELHNLRHIDVKILEGNELTEESKMIARLH